MSLTAIQSRVVSLTKVPTSVVTEAERTAHIEDARKEYSEVRPRLVTIEVAGTGAYEYSLSALVMSPVWCDVNKLQDVLYPAKLRNHSRLERKDWIVYRKPDGTWWLKFLRHYPSAGFAMWLRYTAPHLLDATHDTISTEYPQDVDAFCNLAASKVLKAAAAFYAGKVAPTIGDSAVNWQNMSTDYQKRSNDCKAEYDRQVTVRAVARTGGRINWDSTLTGGADQLFWRRRYS